MNLRRFAFVFYLPVFLLTGCNNGNFRRTDFDLTSVSDHNPGSELNSGDRGASLNGISANSSESVEQTSAATERIDRGDTSTEPETTSAPSSEYAAENIDYTERLRFFQNYSPEITFGAELQADEESRNKAYNALYDLLKNNIIFFDIFVWGVGVELLKPNGEPFYGGDERPIICKCDYFAGYGDFYDTLCGTYTEECVDDLLNNDVFKDGMPVFYERNGLWCANDLPYSWTVNPFYECYYEITDISENMIRFDFLYSFDEVNGTVYSDSRSFEAVLVNDRWLLNKMVYNPM